MNHMELSVIVPTFNEEKTLPALFDSLALQRRISFELIVSDGGSTDGTHGELQRLARCHGISSRTVTGGKGRGDQLNKGAEAACTPFLLFLHADSLFHDPVALRKGVDTVAAVRSGNKNRIVAGRYGLRFNRASPEPSLPFYYYECKARLNRPECAHGDQGIMIPLECYREIGPFRTFPPMLAETRLADRIRSEGELLLIPTELFTSARRFETEGLYRRQVMNAVLMNCAALSWEEPFRLLPEIYSRHDRCGRLRLSPLLEEIYRLIAQMPPGQRARFWYLTGGYVKSNAWQIPFYFDAKRNFVRGLPPGEGPTPLLDRFDRTGQRMIDNPAATALTAAATRLWFSLLRIRARFDDARPG